MNNFKKFFIPPMSIEGIHFWQQLMDDLAKEYNIPNANDTIKPIDLTDERTKQAYNTFKNQIK